MSHLYSVGALVDVAPVARVGRNSEGGRAYVKAKRSSSPTSTAIDSFDVEYVLTRKLSKEVTPDRLSPAIIETYARRRPRSASDVPIQPSLLSRHHRASQQLLSVTPSPPKRAKSNSNLVTTTVLLDRSRNCTAVTDHPIIQYLKRQQQQQQDSGYLRRNDAKAAGHPVPKQGSHMSTEEKTNLLLLRTALSGGAVEFKSSNATSLLAHAFGVSNRQIQRLEKRAGTDLQRKTRSDAGTNILTSSKLQDNWFSAYNCFKKSYRRQKQSDTLLESDITDDRLFDLWNGIMTDEDRKPYIEMSKQQKARLPFLIGDIQQALQRTGGYCTWRQLETHLADGSDGIPIISREVIRRLVMGLPDSQYTSTKLLPALTAAHIIKRKLWCQQFWIFWDSARKLIRKRILLVHMDEKWFYGIVVRMNNKLVPFLGMEKTDSCRSVHHKNYINKFMVLVDSYCLPDGNNIEAGGRGFHGMMIQAGHEEVATTTTYKRVTDPDTGKITYPKTAGNESRIAGQSYFVPAEVTANTREVRGKRKFSLQHDYWPKLINKLEALCRRLRYETGGDDIVPLYQWDGAGPHAKKELIEWRSKEFIDRGWICRNQASQSPHLQVHDTSIFPMLSKIVSNIQAMGSAGVVDNDKLWELVQEAYYNKLSEEVIARAFAHHVQIVNAIYSCDGGDGYHRNGGLHCGVRKAYAPKYKLDATTGQPIGDPIGVELIETPEEETQQQQNRLRYDRPTPEELDLVDWNTDLFNRSQLEFLVANLPYGTAEYLQAEEALHGLESSR